MAGRGRHAGPVAQHRACAARLADPARGGDQLGRRDLGRRRVGSPTPRCRTNSTCWPPRCSPSPAPRGKRRDRSRPQDACWSTASSPAISKRDRAIRSSCCTAGSSASARNSAGSTTSPRWRAHHRVLALDMLGFGQLREGDRLQRRPRHADPAHRAVLRCGRVSNPRTSSATRWARSTCSSTPHRKPRCCLPRSLAMICGGGEIQRNEHSAALYDYDATLAGHAPDRRGALLTTRRTPTTTRTCSGATSPASRPARGRRWRRPRFRRPGLEPPPLPSSTRAYERIAVPTLVVEGACDKLLPAGLGGRDRRADRRAAVRPSSHGPATARRSNSPMPSTTCCWTSSAR